MAERNLDRFIEIVKDTVGRLTNEGPIGQIRGFFRNYFVTPGCPHPFVRGFTMLWYKKLQPLLAAEQNSRKSELELEIIIPAIEKDLATLPHAVAGVRNNLRHPIRKISVVAPDSMPIKEACRKIGVTFLDEATVVRVAKRDIHYSVGGRDRSGWLYQQLIKLSSDSLVEGDHFLVLDADTVLTRPQRLEVNGKTVLLVSDEYHRPYYEAYQRLLNEKPPSLLSFVCHYMLFNRATLRLLKQAIEEQTGKPWAQAIIDAADRGEASGFSEYETYGNFCYARLPGKVMRRYSNNHRFKPGFVSDISKYTAASNGPFDSISFHVYEKEA